jgi:ribosomal protein L30/L7E
MSAATTKRTITIRMKKSMIACPPQQRACLNGLGLKRREQSRTLENTPAVIWSKWWLKPADPFCFC